MSGNLGKRVAHGEPNHPRLRGALNEIGPGAEEVAVANANDTDAVGMRHIDCPVHAKLSDIVAEAAAAIEKRDRFAARLECGLAGTRNQAALHAIEVDRQALQAEVRAA